MKKLFTFFSITFVLVLLFPGCSKEPAISADVKAILEATCNTPNSELHDPSAVLVIGSNTDMTDAEKDAVLQRQAEIDRNWEELLGEYFSPGSFDLFLSSYLRGWFLYDDPVPSKLVSMTLVSKDERQEVVDIQVDIDGTLTELTVTFRRNDDGLLYRTDMEEKYD